MQDFDGRRRGGRSECLQQYRRLHQRTLRQRSDARSIADHFTGENPRRQCSGCSRHCRSRRCGFRIVSVRCDTIESASCRRATSAGATVLVVFIKSVASNSRHAEGALLVGDELHDDDASACVDFVCCCSCSSCSPSSQRGRSGRVSSRSSSPSEEGRCFNGGVCGSVKRRISCEFRQRRRRRTMLWSRRRWRMSRRRREADDR